MDNMEFNYCPDKNAQLKIERGISFEEIIYYLNSGYLIDIVQNPNEKYKHQKFYIIDVEGYAYMVPYVKNGNEIFLKTIWPSRKATKAYLRDKLGLEVAK